MSNGKIPSFFFRELGKPINLIDSDSYQLNFIYGNENNAYSIYFFPKGVLEKLRETLKNVSDLEISL